MAARDQQHFDRLVDLLRDRGEPPARSAAALVRRAFEDGTLPTAITQDYTSRGRFSDALTVHEVRHAVTGRRLAATVEKRLRRPPADDPELPVWLYEPLFYAELRDRLDVPALRVPELHHIRVADRDRVALYLEHVEGCERLRRLEGRKQAAWVFGQLAARAHRDGLHETQWLMQATGVNARGPTATRLLPRALELVEAVCADVAEKERVASALRGVFEDAESLQAVYRECPPTLVHGDANDGNVLGRDAAGLLEVVVLDWPRVQSGRIGDDLGRLVMPWLTSDSGARTPDELLAVEASLLELYEQGPREHAPDLDAQALRFAYELRSVVTTVTVSPFLTGRLDLGGKADAARRKEALRSWFTILAERVPALRRTAGGQGALTQRYLGEGAASYNEVRAKSPRWRREHELVESFLSRYPRARVFDCPVGTGRFIPLYAELGCRLSGVDISADMLAEARRTAEANDFEPDRLVVADATAIDPADFAGDVAVSVRFFNWLSPQDAARAFANIAATAGQAMIVSLSSTDAPEVRAAPLKEGGPLNYAHRDDDFADWVRQAGLQIAEVEDVVRGKGRLVNRLYLLTRVT